MVAPTPRRLVTLDSGNEYGFGDQQLCADERHWRLEELPTAPGQELLYRYDFGDDWRHQVVLEKVLPAGAERRAAGGEDGAGGP